MYQQHPTPLPSQQNILNHNLNLNLPYQPTIMIPDEIKPTLQQKSSTISSSSSSLSNDQPQQNQPPINEKNLDILISKLINEGQLTDIQLQQLSQNQKIAIEEIQQRIENKTKRPDEYQKMFFKKAFKYAENVYFRKNKKNRSRRMSHFYHFYFDEVIERHKQKSIEEFYHPDKKTKPGLKKGQKSFNSTYIKSLLESRRFKNTCVEYHSKFVTQTKRQRNKKVQTFSKSIHEVIKNHRTDSFLLKKFLNGSKCKIPWTNRQIQQAYKVSGEFLNGMMIDQEDQQKEEKNWEKQGSHSNPHLKQQQQGQQSNLIEQTPPQSYSLYHSNQSENILLSQQQWQKQNFPNDQQNQLHHHHYETFTNHEKQFSNSQIDHYVDKDQNNDFDSEINDLLTHQMNEFIKKRRSSFELECEYFSEEKIDAFLDWPDQALAQTTMSCKDSEIGQRIMSEEKVENDNPLNTIPLKELNEPTTITEFVNTHLLQAPSVSMPVSDSFDQQIADQNRYKKGF